MRVASTSSPITKFILRKNVISPPNRLCVGIPYMHCTRSYANICGATAVLKRKQTSSLDLHYTSFYTTVQENETFGRHPGV